MGYMFKQTIYRVLPILFLWLFPMCQASALEMQQPQLSQGENKKIWKRDYVFKEPGLIGVWSKADAQTAFSNLEAEQIGP